MEGKYCFFGWENITIGFFSQNEPRKFNTVLFKISADFFYSIRQIDFNIDMEGRRWTKHFWRTVCWDYSYYVPRLISCLMSTHKFNCLTKMGHTNKIMKQFLCGLILFLFLYSYVSNCLYLWLGNSSTLPMVYYQLKDSSSLSILFFWM